MKQLLTFDLISLDLFKFNHFCISQSFDILDFILNSFYNFIAQLIFSSMLLAHQNYQQVALFIILF